MNNADENENYNAIELLTKKCQDNPGAFAAITALFDAIADKPINRLALELLAHHTPELAGPDIWILFKDECNREPNKFAKAIFKYVGEMEDE